MAYNATARQPERQYSQTAQRVSAAVLAAALLTSGACASIRHPRSQTVWVHSRPSGAEVFMGERHAGITPVAITPNRRARKTLLRLEKDGFVPLEFPLGRSLNPWLSGDLVLPVMVSAGAAQEARGRELTHVFAGTLAFTIGIDFLTGAAFRFPGSVSATLARSLGGVDRERTASTDAARLDGSGVRAGQNLRKRNRLLPAWLIGKHVPFVDGAKR